MPAMPPPDPSSTPSASAASALPEPNLAAAITVHAAERPEATAVVDSHASRSVGSTDLSRRSLTWAGFDRAVTEAASALARLGVVAGQRVLIEATNTIDAVCAWFGALRAGIIAVPVNPAMTTEESCRVAEHSGAVLLLGCADVPGVRTVALTDLRSRAGPDQVASPQDPEAVAAVVYTAGTSGDPKGVMLSHRALIAHCTAAGKQGIVRPGAVVLCCLPLFHVLGLNAVLGSAVFAGATVVLTDDTPDQVEHVLGSERVTHLPLTPSALYRLSLHPEILAAARSLELVLSGAAPLPAVLAGHWLRLTGTPVQQGYGLTEAGPGVTSTAGTKWLGTNHVGRALPGVEIRIGDGSQPTEAAEVWIRGRNLFSGYWPDGRGGVDEEGWFATGDVGYLMDEDLFLVDRVREIVIVSGFNVYPSEIEKVLKDHPDVESAAVVGQADEQTGERVVAFVTGDAVQAPALMAYAGSRLAPYKVPSEMLVIKAMPRTPTGKIRKALLRDLLDRTDEEDL